MASVPEEIEDQPQPDDNGSAKAKELATWLKKLNEQLDARMPLLQRWSDYYDGKHRLSFATSRFREVFGSLFSEYADNFCDVVVDSVEERLQIDGFRFAPPLDDEGRPIDGGGTSPTALSDAKLWRIWQANQLDAMSGLAHTEAGIQAESFALVWTNPKDENTPLITIEHPTQMIVATSPGNRRIRLAAMKRWLEDDGRVNATLYLPDGIYKFQSAGKHKSGTGSKKIRWVRREVADEEWPLANPLEVVPVVPIANRKRLLGPAKSELVVVIPRQDAINKLCVDLLVAAEFVGFPQRWATGIEIPEDPENADQPVENFRQAVDRLWHVESDTATFGQFPAADLKPYVDAIESQLYRLASATRTPPHYFMAGMGQFPSGESLKSSETGLVKKVYRAARHFGEDWEEIMRLAMAVIEDPRAEQPDLETIWHDPESRTVAETTDAALKKKDLGIPWEVLMEDLGYTPQQIARMRKLNEEDAELFAAAFDPTRRTEPTPEPEPKPEPTPQG